MGGFSSSRGRQEVNLTLTPSGDLSADTYAGAIAELDAEKAPLSHTHPYAPIGVTTVGSAGTSTTLDVSGKSDFDVTLNQASCAISTTGWPAGVHAVNVTIRQDATGGRKATWPGVVWESGEGNAPVLWSAASSRTVVTLYSTNGGATVRGLHFGTVVWVPWSTARGVNLAVKSDSGAFPMMYPGRIVAVKAVCRVAPVGASILVDVNKNGTTIWTTQSKRPAIATTAVEATLVTDIDVPDLAVNDLVTTNVDQVGSSTPGQALTVLVGILKAG